MKNEQLSNSSAESLMAWATRDLLTIWANTSWWTSAFVMFLVLYFLGDSDEMKWGPSSCYFFCKMGLLCAFLCIRTSVSSHLESWLMTLMVLEKGIFFCHFLSLVCSWVRTKSYAFSAKALSQTPVTCLVQIYSKIIYSKIASWHFESVSSTCCAPWAINP